METLQADAGAALNQGQGNGAKPGADPAMMSGPDYEALMAKHRAEIDRILALTPEEQKKQVQSYGVDPVALEAHYPDLIKRGDELRRAGRLANFQTFIVTAVSGAAGGLVAFAKRKSLHESKLIQGVLVALTTSSAATMGMLAGGAVLGGDLKKQGKELTTEARYIFERELAVAIENQERKDRAVAATTVSAATVNTQSPAPTADNDNPINDNRKSDGLRRPDIGPRPESYREAAASTPRAAAALG